LLLWAALGVGGSLFLAVAIGLLIVCLRHDEPVSAPSFAEVPFAVAQDLPAPAPTEAAVPQPEQSPSKPGTEVTPAPAQAAISPAAAKPDAVPAAAEVKAATSLVLARAKIEPPADGIAASKSRTPAGIEAAAKAAIHEYPSSDPVVNRAIARGIAFLKRSDDFRIGGKALAGLTLLSCGVSPKDSAVVRLATALRAGLPLTATYELALCLLFLDRLGDRQDEALIRRIALQLIAGQGIQGGWNYHCFALTPKQEKKLLTLLQAPVRRASEKQVFTGRGSPTVGLPADLRDLPAMQYRPGQQMRFQQSQWHEDNSLTQFVILALWTSQKHGIPAERPLAMVEARFRASQNSDGGWGYKWGAGGLGGSFRADSMTCAGLLGLAVGRGVEPADLTDKAIPAREPIAKAALKKTAKKANGDRAIENALMFLSQKIGAPAPAPQQLAAAEQMKANALLMNLQLQLAQAPPAQRPFIMQRLQGLVKIDNRLKARGTIVGANARGDLYYLWSLERVGVAYDLRTIGGKDWYAWGAPLILVHQQDDGSWADLYPGVPDTCFALLFLKRVNVASDLTRNLQRLTLSREAAGRMREPLQGSGSSGQPVRMAEPKGPPLRTRE